MESPDLPSSLSLRKAGWWGGGQAQRVRSFTSHSMKKIQSKLSAHLQSSATNLNENVGSLLFEGDGKDVAVRIWIGLDWAVLFR
jgi:hypothetical protein